MTDKEVEKLYLLLEVISKQLELQNKLIERLTIIQMGQLANLEILVKYHGI
jgi:hypothetical protein